MNTLLTLISTVILTSNFTSTPPTFAQSGADINTKVQHLSHKAPQLNKNVLKLALTAYTNASKKGAVKKPVLTVIDYSLPSNKQRMWIFDVRNERLLYNTYVAHGKNSGANKAKHFSNIESSKESSLGTYITKNTYIGHKGYSLNLQGLDKGFNDNALNRRVVVHGAWYVEPDFIKRAGRAGLSWGCPAIAQTLAKPIINTIKNGSVIFAYFPDKRFLSKSGYLVA
ncbi:MAG: murein L,D-transpeptidase catalytic domain family protein [Legionella longbeachae]|nr:murein L,D-transpeptidase catalytic domain family protein [Legionella longbeachae]